MGKKTHQYTMIEEWSASTAGRQIFMIKKFVVGLKPRKYFYRGIFFASNIATDRRTLVTTSPSVRPTKCTSLNGSSEVLVAKTQASKS